MSNILQEYFGRSIDTNNIIGQLFDTFAVIMVDQLMVIMIFIFLLAILAKFFIHITIKMENRFTFEFEKRVHRHLDKEYKDTVGLKNFHDLTEKILTKTHYEIYTMRDINKRRKLDRVHSLKDRLFMAQEASNRLIEDTLKQTTYTKNQVTPDFQSMAKFVFTANPYYNRAIGLFPIQTLDRLLSVLPGLFIIAGIFGTFLGIIKGLPALREMDPSNVAAAKAVLGMFLTKMSYAMYTSLLGIILSVIMTITNTIWSPSIMLRRLVLSYTLSMQFLWKDSIKAAESHPPAKAPESKPSTRHKVAKSINTVVTRTKNENKDRRSS